VPALAWRAARFAPAALRGPLLCMPKALQTRGLCTAVVTTASRSCQGSEGTTKSHSRTKRNTGWRLEPHVELAAERLHIVRAKAHGRLDVEVGLEAVDERTHAVAWRRASTVVSIGASTTPASAPTKRQGAGAPAAESSVAGARPGEPGAGRRRRAPASVTPYMRRMGTSYRSVRCTCCECTLGGPMK